MTTIAWSLAIGFAFVFGLHIGYFNGQRDGRADEFAKQGERRDSYVGVYKELYDEMAARLRECESQRGQP